MDLTDPPVYADLQVPSESRENLDHKVRWVLLVIWGLVASWGHVAHQGSQDHQVSQAKKDHLVSKAMMVPLVAEDSQGPQGHQAHEVQSAHQVPWAHLVLVDRVVNLVYQVSRVLMVNRVVRDKVGHKEEKERKVQMVPTALLVTLALLVTREILVREVSRESEERLEGPVLRAEEDPVALKEAKDHVVSLDQWESRVHKERRVTLDPRERLVSEVVPDRRETAVYLASPAIPAHQEVKAPKVPSVLAVVTALKAMWV